MSARHRMEYSDKLDVEHSGGVTINVVDRFDHNPK
jgi:hypothetical protein